MTENRDTSRPSGQGREERGYRVPPPPPRQQTPSSPKPTEAERPKDK